jgi:hypothetical protein
MARKPVSRSLPSLQQLHPRFRGFAPTDNASEAVLRLLRETASRVRGDAEAAFYAVREATAFFGVPYKTVQRAYQRLAAEGLLRLVRGSRTLVRSQRLQPRHPILGVVGVPVLLASFLFGSAGRLFFMTLERELRRRHFVADFLFYRDEDEGHPDLAEHFIEHDLDILLWMSPQASAMPTILTLLDGGVAAVIVSDGKAVFPREQYRVDLERAYGEAVADWRNGGITDVEIWAPAAGWDEHILHTFHRALRRAAMPAAVHRMADAAVPSRIRALRRRRHTGVALISHQWYDGLCAQFPGAMETLFRQQRVLLTQGPLYHPGFAGRHICCDAIRMDHERMATRIATDIASGRTNTTATLATFPMTYSPRTNLGAVQRGT